MDKEEIKRIIHEELRDLLGTDRYTFQKKLQIFDARDVQVGKTTGTTIATETTQKLAFWAQTPIVQPASANQAALSLNLDVSGANTCNVALVSEHFGKIQTLVNQLRTDLINEGLIKGSA